MKLPFGRHEQAVMTKTRPTRELPFSGLDVQRRSVSELIERQVVKVLLKLCEGDVCFAEILACCLLHAHRVRNGLRKYERLDPFIPGGKRRKLCSHTVHVWRQLPRCRIHRKKHLAIGERKQRIVVPEHGIPPELQPKKAQRPRLERTLQRYRWPGLAFAGCHQLAAFLQPACCAGRRSDRSERRPSHVPVALASTACSTAGTCGQLAHLARPQLPLCCSSWPKAASSLPRVQAWRCSVCRASHQQRVGYGRARQRAEDGTRRTQAGLRPA